jgi:hypothetical protein
MVLGYPNKRFHEYSIETACWDPFARKKSKEERHAVLNDADLAKEMNGLSFEEREKVFDDVHGVAAAHDETPDFVEKCLRDFDTALAKVKSSRKALNRALFLWPELKTDEAFKLRFLRSELFDCEKAAERMANYYEHKKTLFGEEKLVKTITMDDLSEGDSAVIKGDFVVELPFKDSQGRPVVFVDNSKLDFSSMTIDGLVGANRDDGGAVCMYLCVN